MGILRRIRKKLPEEKLKLVPLIAQDLEMQLTNCFFHLKILRNIPYPNSIHYLKIQLEYQQSKFKFRVPIKNVDFYFYWNEFLGIYSRWKSDCWNFGLYAKKYRGYRND